MHIIIANYKFREVNILRLFLFLYNSFTIILLNKIESDIFSII